MPTNFWRNEQMLNIFRTKPCQRLTRDGVCRWRSQCQYSHCPEWPRRQPRKYTYSPEVCPHIRVTAGGLNGAAQVENLCLAGLNCPKAHSKEEVLFHPHFFKTSLCKEHASQAGQRSSRSARGARRHRCHRYYCPFAHGPEELRPSPLSEEQRERCLQMLEIFPSDDCCTACTRYWLTPYHRAEERSAAVLDLDSHLPFPWPQPAPAPAITPQLWELLAGGGGQALAAGEAWPREEPEDREAQPSYPLVPAYRPIGTGHGALEKPANPWGDMPAFIDVSDVRSTADDPLQLDKVRTTSRARELLGEVVYAML